MKNSLKRLDYDYVDIVFCHNRSCMRSYTVNEILEEGQCNNCRKELFTMSLGEKQQLPADTTLLKKRYANDRRPNHKKRIHNVICSYHPRSIARFGARLH